MSHFLRTDTCLNQSSGTASTPLVAVRLESANKKIFRALLNLSSANLLLRLMGLVSTVVVTARFGQGSQMDAYFVASALPILLAQLLESSLEDSIIPVYARLHTKEGREQVSRLFSTLLNLIIVGSIPLMLIMLAFRGQLLYISAPGTNADILRQAMMLAPLVFPVLVVMIANSFMECILNAEGTFGWPAYAGLLRPLTTVALVLLLGNSGGIFALGIGTLIGQCLQLCVICIRAHKAKLKYRPIIDLRLPEIKAVAVLMWPGLVAGIISLSSPLVDQIFASYQMSGTIAAINNALKLTSVATGVIFSAVGRAALPYLAIQAAIKDMKAFKATLRLYLWGVTLVTLVISAVLIVFAEPIIAILFQRGAFNAVDTHMTAITLQGFAIGLAPMAIGFTLSRALSALGQALFLTGVTVFNIICNAVFDAIFSRFWHSFGIAFATSLFYFCSIFILVFGLRKMIGKLDLLTPPPELLPSAWKSALEPYFTKWQIWREDNLIALDISLRRRIRQILRWFFILMVFAAGIYGSITSTLFTVRIAFGSIVVLAFLRYQYLLLLVWASMNVFIGSPLPFFNGNNFLSGFTLPTFLLLFYLPTKKAFKCMPTLPFLLAFLLWILFSFWYTSMSMGEFFKSWFILFDFFSVCVLVIMVINTQQRLLHFIDTLHFPAIFVAVYGLWGYATHTVGILGQSGSYFRITSIFPESPPGLGLYLSIIIPMTVYRLSTLWGLKKLGGIAVLLLLLITLALTFDRGALVIVPFSAIAVIPLLPGRKMKAIVASSYLVAGILTIVVSVVFGIHIYGRFFNSDLGTFNGRIYLWQAVLDRFDPTQLQGYGFHASDTLLTNLQVGFAGGTISTVTENIFLEIMYDHGLIGLTLLLLVFLVQGISLLRKWFVTKSTQHRFLLALVLWTLISVTILCNETNDIWKPQIGIYFFMVMSLPFAVCWEREELPT